MKHIEVLSERFSRMKMLKLEHSKIIYYADYVFYISIMLALGTYIVLYAPSQGSWLSMAMVIIVGFLLWSLVEYAMHRLVFHGIEPFQHMHAEHHRQPRALIATPTIVSAALITIFFSLPAILLTGYWLGAGITLGFITGYFLYGLLHHAVHHWRVDHKWLRKKKRLHAIHHAFPHFNFGVTQSFWDNLFNSMK